MKDSLHRHWLHRGLILDVLSGIACQHRAEGAKIPAIQRLVNTTYEKFPCYFPEPELDLVQFNMAEADASASVDLSVTDTVLVGARLTQNGLPDMHGHKTRGPGDDGSTPSHRVLGYAAM